MTTAAVTVESVSKIYRIWGQEVAPDNLAASAWGFVKSPIANFKRYRSLYDFRDVWRDESAVDREDILWALRDVSFTITPGEVVGIIGVNGAGKTTLLKILSKITPPSRGMVRIRGRVSSLLEVGTGFHAELTGRENIYLNGTILGMRKAEVDRKFDEIAAFSGVERFLDTPVKRYSSGMRVRLAFAVAAHLEPEVLIIDEVLAVGDADFQQKCLSKMEQVGEEGRTVLFVSHNMPAVTRLCQRGILLNQGRMMLDTSATEAVSHYLASGLGNTAQRRWEDQETAPGDDSIRLRAVAVVNARGDVSGTCDIRTRVGLKVDFEVLEEGNILIPQFVVKDENSATVFTAIHTDEEWHSQPRMKGKYSVTAWIPGNLLSERTYYVTIAVRTPKRKYRPFQEKDAAAFQVVDSMSGDSVRGSWVGRLEGAVRPALEWESDFEPGDPEVLLQAKA